jgi:hypothetical protein
MLEIYGQKFDFPCVFDSWFRHFATIWKVAVSIPDGVIGIFHLPSPSGRTLALGSTQASTKMSTRAFFWKYRHTIYAPSVSHQHSFAVHEIS